MSQCFVSPRVSCWALVAIALGGTTPSSAEPLQPANASFSAAADLDLLTHNFGTVRQGAADVVFDFAIHNRPALAGATAGLSLTDVEALGDDDSIALVCPPIAGLAASSSIAAQLELSTQAYGELAVSYKLEFDSDGLPESPPQFLAIAAFAVVLQAGDYDLDGDVDLDDYDRWKSTYGSQTVLDADGNIDGVVDSADYTVWRNNFLGWEEAGGGGIAVAPVPEPATLPMTALVATIFTVTGTASQRSRARIRMTH